MGFEDLEVWKRAARLSAEIYQKTNGLKDYGFRDQLTRSGLSVASNIAEGIERDSPRDTAKFLRYSKGSAGELRTQIYIGIEAGYIDRNIGFTWAEESKQLGKMLGSLIQRYKRMSDE
jgi:four helix bundle protein